MQIVIDIPKDRYKEIVSGLFDADAYFKANLTLAFRNGTVLHEHGRLGDLDYLYKKFEANGCKDSNVYRLIKDEPTIIEAGGMRNE